MKRSHFYKIWTLCVFIVLTVNHLNSQVLISNTSGTADASAMLEVKSTSGGLLIPRMTSDQRTSIDNGTGDPTEGLLVFDTDDDAFYIFENGEWTNLSMSAEIWSQNSSYVYLTNSTNNVGIGTSSPGSKLVIQADQGADVDDVLFEVLDESGNPIFEVTSIGARIYVIDPDEAGTATTGGFAVGEYNTLKDKGITPCFSTDPDETRVYSANATTGGFAVGEYNTLKDAGDIYMFMIPENYLIGHQSGELLQTGSFDGKYNTFFGYQTGIQNTRGGSNVFIGYQSGMENIGNIDGSDSLGFRNVFLGYQAGYSNTYGSDNVLLGYQAGYNVTTAVNNISIGSNAGFNNENNDDNIFIGRQAGYNHIGTGTENSSINNIYIGLNAGYGHESSGNVGNNNTFIGTQAGYTNNLGDNNIFIGKEAGYSNRGHASGEYGDNNIYLGNEAGRENWYGARNIFIGYQAGRNSGSSGSISANDNIFIGDSAGYSNLTGRDNVFIGNCAGKSNEVGVYNTIIGEGAGENIVGWMDGLVAKGSHNTFLGKSAGNSSTGLENTYIGGGCATYNVHGQKNVIMGRYATFWSEGGSENVIIGYGAGNLDPYSQDSIGDGNVFIGYYAGTYQEVSDRLFIENSSSSSPLIYGEFDNNLLKFNGDVEIENFSNPSSLKFYESGTGSNYTEFISQVQSSDITYTLPAAAGTDNQVLTTDGSSVLSWESVGGNIVTAGNGLNFDEAPRVELGGALDESTVITLGGYHMTFDLSNTGDFRVRDNNDLLAFYVNNSGNVYVNQNIGINTEDYGDGNKVIAIENGTAPTSNCSNGVILFAEDIPYWNGSAWIYRSELRVRDERNNVTTLSPHNFTLTELSEPMAWSFYSENHNINQKINVDMLRAIRLIEELSGEKLVVITDFENKTIQRNTSEKTSLREKVEEQEKEIEELKKQILELREIINQ